MIEVTRVEGRNQIDEFIKLPGRILAADPNWIEPLWLERRRFLSPRTNPFFEHADVALWLARRDVRAVGRISAQIDHLMSDVDGLKVGFFGMLTAEDDPDILPALFRTAEAWLVERGVGIVRGPFEFNINQVSGLLVEGFDTPPSLMMTHDPPWLGPGVERLGYAKAKDLFAYHLNTRKGLTERLQKMAERASPEVTLRSLDMRRYREEVTLITDIHNDAWSDNWGFIPLTEAETDAMADEMKAILYPDLVKIAELHGEPVAFIALLPNINEAIRDLGGRLLPFGWLKLLWRLKVGGIRSARIPLMGVRRAYSNTLLGKSLPLKLIYALQPRGLARGFEEIELSWLLEDNMPARRMVELMGSKRAKTYRIYEKRLETAD